ncbi:PTS sugar transporter subunit IIA [Candidatus Ruminimicrobium bovinum]|uniref:PTS sugar transporter subunit IIA n=1 Tax=Candidatus Ruminimicrobium bovinum TaxID=3242779 RepID=UPI0039B92597
MIKILIVAHCGLTEELIKSAEFIAGKQENLMFVSKNTNDESLSSLQEKILNIIKENDDGSGVLILTDMFGGTPYNASMKVCLNTNIEVLTGVNLPMVLSAVFSSKTVNSVTELANKVLNDGLKSIVNAKQLFLEKMK